MSQHDPHYPVTTFDDFRAFVRGIGELYGERTACVWYDADGAPRAYSYNEIRGDAEALGAALSDMGLAGKHVAILGENSHEWLTALFAVTSTGGVAVPIDADQPDDVLWRMIERADAEAAVFSPSFCELFGKKAAEGRIAAICMGESPCPKIHGFRALLERGRELIARGEEPKGAVPVGRDTLAMIVYTSGTTSVSKPVMLSHYNLQFNASKGSAMLYMGETIYSSLPLNHTYGLTCGVINQFSQGHTMYLNGDIRTMMRDLKLANPECAIVVPLIAEAMLMRARAEMKRRGGESPECLKWLDALNARFPMEVIAGARRLTEELFGDRLIRMVCGGAHLSREIVEQFAMLGIEVFQGYGITECSPLVSVNRNHANKLGTVGQLLPETEVKLVSKEIWVRGPSVGLGYYKAPELTAEAFHDGWFKTGDIGQVDRGGFLSINGRIKNLIVFKNGKKVAPEEIEESVKDIPVIKEAMAYGAATGASVDDVKLVLMVYPDPTITRGMGNFEILRLIQAEIDRVNKNLPPYKQIQTIRLRDTEFEKTALRKIKRYVAV